MEVKPLPYADMPEFTEEVEGAKRIKTTGDEIGARLFKDIVYADVDGTPLHLQIIMPYTWNNQRQRRELPCIVYVQGSGWKKQDCFLNIPVNTRLAERGYVMAVVEYRHSGIAHFPAQVEDVKNAVRFMRANAEKYNVDPDKMVLMGNSSGGHSVMYTTLISDEACKVNSFPGVSSEVKGLIDLYGATSVMADDANPTTLNHHLPDSPEGLVMGADMRANPELRKVLSVETNLTEDTVMPPTLIMHGTLDRIVNCTGSVALYRKMKELGKEVSLYLIEGADHGGPAFWIPEVLDVVDNFIQDVINR